MVLSFFIYHASPERSLQHIIPEPGDEFGLNDELFLFYLLQVETGQ